MRHAIVTPEEEARDIARDALREPVEWYEADAWTVAVVHGDRTDFIAKDDQELLFIWPHRIDSDDMASNLMCVFADGEKYAEGKR